LQASGQGPDCKEYPVTGKSLVIGRDPEQCDIVVAGTSISRTHARIESIGNDKFRLTNLNSTNGLYLNTKKINTSCPISHNDIVGLGCPHAAHLRFLRTPCTCRLRADILPPQSSWTIGRRPDCDICLPFAPTVSGHHATLQVLKGELHLIDESSLNGTWVNDRSIVSAQLDLTDCIVIGTTELRFHLTENGALQVERRQRAGNLRLSSSGLTCLSGRGKGAFPILNNIDLLIAPGEFVGILGPSGAGKTTLLQSLSGQRRPDSGTVLLNDTPLYDAYAMFRDLLGYVPQDDILHSELNVVNSLNTIARLRLPLDLDIGQRQDIVNRVLTILDLNKVRGLRIDQLSGGQRKRVSIGAELITRPGLLFLDEPVSGLDPGIAAKLMRHFKAMTKAGTTVVMTTHNLDALDLMDKIVLLARGEMVFFGTPAGAMDFFKKETGNRVTDPVDIFHILEGDAAEMSSSAPMRQGINRKAIATLYAEKYRNSSFYKLNILKGNVPKQDPLITQQDISNTQAPSSISLPKPAYKKPHLPFSPAHWFCLSKRHIMIRLGAPKRIITYALIPLLLALVTLSLNIKGFPDQETSTIRKQAMELQLRHGGPQLEIAVKNLLSPKGLQDSKPAWRIIHALRYEGPANLPIPIGVLLMGIMTAVFLGTVSSCLEISSERQIYLRERMAGMRIFDYLASKLPFCLTMTALQCLIFIGCCSLHPAMARLPFLPIYFILTSLAWTSVAMGLFISSLDPTPGRFSILLAVAAVLPQLILSGGLGPDFFKHMHAISKIPASLLPARWGLEMELTAVYSGNPETTLSWIPACIEQVIGFDYGSSVYYHGTSVLAVQTIVSLLLCAWLLKRRDPV
jgi:ABC-type multidrug transport system ATPase subunit/pSer/pThr/pTyr-binding forkhead associated (FHA) protein